MHELLVSLPVKKIIVSTKIEAINPKAAPNTATVLLIFVIPK